MKKMTFIAFHYLNLSIRCEELDTHIKQLYLFLKSTYCEYILEKILSTSEVGPILALIAPSPLRVEVAKHPQVILAMYFYLGQE